MHDVALQQYEQELEKKTKHIADMQLEQKLMVQLKFLKEVQCVKCRKKQAIKDGAVEKTANGRRMAKGICPECGTKVTRFLPNKEAE